MFNSSPITTWEGATVFWPFASGGTMLWFWLSVLCCLYPVWVALRAEHHAHQLHK